MCTQYTRHKYTLTNILNSFQMNHQQSASGKDMYENGHMHRIVEKPIMDFAPW